MNYTTAVPVSVEVYCDGCKVQSTLSLSLSRIHELLLLSLTTQFLVPPPQLPPPTAMSRQKDGEGRLADWREASGGGAWPGHQPAMMGSEEERIYQRIEDG